MATKTRVSLEEFLAMPETEPPSELIEGEVVQKMAPNIYHARLTSGLIGRLERYFEEHPEGFVSNEARHLSASESRIYVPDISVFRSEHEARAMAAGEGPISIPPDFAIEVLSPGQSHTDTVERAAFFMRTGTQLVWVVDPRSEAVVVYRPDRSPEVRRAPEQIDASPVLNGFVLDLGWLFQRLGGAPRA